MKKENKILTFNLNSFEILEDNTDVSIVKMKLLHLGENRNKCDIDKECCISSESSVYNCPIIYRLNNKYFPSGSTDVAEHSRDNDSTMQIGGIVPKDTPILYVYDEVKKKTYMEVMGIIYKVYQPMLMNILNKKDGSTKISIEIIVLDGEKKSNGILKINKMRFRGITLLGDNITEGIEGSNLNVVIFSENELNNKFKIFSHSNIDKYSISENAQHDVKNLYDSYKINHKGLTEKEFLVVNSINDTKSGTMNDFKILKTCFENFNQKFDFNYNCDWINKIIENEVIEMSLGVEELRNALYTDLSKYTYNDGNWTGRKYYVHEIYTEEHEVIIRDNENGNLYKAHYEVDKDGDVKVNIEEKKEVRLTYEDKYEDDDNECLNAYVFSKSNYGSNGKKLIVSKEKEDMSDGSWGSVNKSELRKKILDAPNYKSLVKDVYLEVEDGWEESPSTKLKYPIMEIKGDKLVYNRNALSSAKGYAETEDTTSVLNKLKKIYKKMDLDNTKEGKLMTEKEKKNKLDEDNKEIEKVKDDIDADEDDEKEELKKNAVAKKPEEKLDDDADADKDYWKKKYAQDIEVKNLEIEKMKEKFAQMERKELEEKMNSLVEEYAHCYSDEEKKSLKEEMVNSKTEEEFSAKVFACVAKNAKELKNKEVKNSFVASPFGANFGYNVVDEKSNVEDISTLANKYRK